MKIADKDGKAFHPAYHKIKVVMTNGTEFETYSTYGEEGASLALDIDPTTHPAWTGGDRQLMDARPFRLTCQRNLEVYDGSLIDYGRSSKLVPGTHMPNATSQGSI